jgi:hypothetical protein
MNEQPRGNDRIKLLTVNAQARIATQRVKRHKQICADCAHAGESAAKFCDEGWELVKAAHKAINAQRDYQRSLIGPAPGEQGTLW